MLFNGQLNANEVYASQFNMILFIRTHRFGKGNGYSTLVEEAKEEGGLYGDIGLFYAVPLLRTTPWAGRAVESAKLLNQEYQKLPDPQKLTINVFRKIVNTTDELLSKRMYHEAGAFGEFISLTDAQISKTKRIYEQTTYNVFIGTNKSSVQADYEIDITTATGGASTVEETNRLEAQKIATDLADLEVEMKDVQDKFNDFGETDLLDISELRFVISSTWANKIKLTDVPTIFNKDGVENTIFKNVVILPSHYFGTINSTATVGDGSTIYAAVELDFNQSNPLDEGNLAPQNPSYDKKKHVVAGQLIPTGETAPAGTSYTVDSDIIGKIMHKNAVPYLSAFSIGADFFNPRGQATTKYAIWGHNTLEYLKQYPFFNVVKK